MKCEYCGSELAEGANFCGNCGSPVARVDSHAYEEARYSQESAAQSAVEPAKTDDAEKNLLPEEPTQPEPTWNHPPEPAPAPVVDAQTYTPPPPSTPPFVTPSDNREGLGVISLVLGVIGLCTSVIPFCGIPLAIAAAIAGFMGLRTERRSLAQIGIILAVVAAIISILISLFFLGSFITSSQISY